MRTREEWQRLQAHDLDLLRTIRSGQAFRYEERHDHIALLTDGRALQLRQDGTSIHFSGADAATVRTIFGDDEEHLRRCRRLARDPMIAPIVERYRGLRVMRLGLHETIIGFLCSSQSNIPRIRRTVQEIARHLGRRNGTHYDLPSPGTELSENRLRETGAGFRATYLSATNPLLTPQFMERLSHATYPQARAQLCTLPGVGPKIADCICLFGLGHTQAFPVDVHVHRAMRVLFPRARLTTPERTQAYAQARWGNDAGLAQQLLYEWARESRASREHLEDAP